MCCSDQDRDDDKYDNNDNKIKELRTKMEAMKKKLGFMNHMTISTKIGNIIVGTSFFYYFCDQNQRNYAINKFPPTTAVATELSTQNGFILDISG